MSLVLLMGASGSGKSTFAKRHFLASEVVSSDGCRAIVSNDENSLAATNDAFDLLFYIIGKRLKNGLLTVVDATNVQASSRKKLVQLAREYHCLPSIIVLDMPLRLCEDRNAARKDRSMGAHVIRHQHAALRKSMRNLKREGFRKIHLFKSTEELDTVTGIEKEKLYNDRKDLHGPFDLIGDVHGCYVELCELLAKLGYQITEAPADESNYGIQVIPPKGRQVIFLGDLVDRGPASVAVLKLAMSMVNAGHAICVPGNHDMKLLRWLKGKNVAMTHGIEGTIAELEQEPASFKVELRDFLYKLVSHFVLDRGRLVVCHAGLKEKMQGRASGAVRSFCLFGESTGEIDEYGLPVRYNWAKDYRGEAKVVYGHTPIPKAEWLNKTINLDTGCVFGGSLTAMRYPEEDLVSVVAKEVYWEPTKSLTTAEVLLTSQQEHDDLLDIDDVRGKRIVQTGLMNNLTIREENSISALEIMGRFAVNPKWLIYLPPTMSPCETSASEEYLEHPLEAINYYKKRGIKTLVCEEKHMGSRAVIVLCRSEAVALNRFGIKNDGFGKCYTRTGRNFFAQKQAALEQAFLEKVRAGLDKANVWEKFDTDWICLDCELMPWSAKAQALLKEQYAAVGSAASHALPVAITAMQQASARGITDLEELLTKYKYRDQSISKFIKAYRQYCWPLESVDDFKLAPFHILASEGQVHSNKSNEWHMQKIAEIVEKDSSLFQATPYKIVDTDSEESIETACSWWMDLTQKGGEGMVVKPLDFICHEDSGKLLQPAVKCRGKEYLRIIYGAEYDHPSQLARLKKRGLSRKRSLALREFALGIESLKRFVAGEPLRRIHESVFAVLALESEEVDPGL